MPHLDRTDSQVDPLLSERRRAQRRLIGALVLILGAVIVLPILLDSQPQPASHNITIEIPKSLFETCKKRAIQAQKNATSHLSDPSALDALCDDSESSFEHVSNFGLGSSRRPSSQNPGNANRHTTVLIQTNPTKPTSAASATPPAAPAPVVPSTAVASKPIPAPSARSSARSNTQPVPGYTAARPLPPGSRFFIHIGHFANKAYAEAATQKLKAAGFPAFLEHRKASSQASKVQKISAKEAFFIRIGPFNDRAHAQQALDTIGKMNLNKGKGTGQQTPYIDKHALNN